MTFIRHRETIAAVPANTSTLVTESFDQLRTLLEPEDHLFWCRMAPQDRPSFTEPLLEELHAVQRLIARLASGAEAQVRWVVLASGLPDVFNLGGDLALFAERIRARDVDGLRRYAHACVQVSHRNATGYGAGAITVGLAQGDALGGGFESLLSCDVLVAERRARFGLPEILFGLFPGMGAHCFLTRRLGALAAERLIMSGKVHSAEEMHAMGIVDVLAEDGEGEDAVRTYVRRNARLFGAHSAIHAARRRVSPVSYEELRDVTDIWVEAAMKLGESDVRRMLHLSAAQDRSRQRQAGRVRQPVAAGAA